jgi:DNA polymerase-1
MNQDASSARLLLIDGLNLVRRVYEANPVEDSPEKAQGALRFSLASFIRALKEHQPTHVLAPFDHGGLTWRHELYPAYKQGRKPIPQPLRDVLPELFERLAQMGVTPIRVAGVEADDVIATACHHWTAGQRGEVTVLSTDKDLAALMVLGARIRDHFKPEWRDEAWVQNKFGVAADKLHDLLALTGDSTDGVPGVPGVAAKTAAKLLHAYGSLDGVLTSASSVKGKLGESLQAHVDTVRLARELVTLRTDVPLGLTWRMLRYSPR